MALWDFVVAGEIFIREHCAEEIEKFLKGLQKNDLFNPSTWKSLRAFVKIIPDGDVLPARCKFSAATNDWQVGVNFLYADNEHPEALWFSLPDVAASVILTGKAPRIVDAFKIEPRCKRRGIESVSLYGKVKINPAKEDFFRVVIEERKKTSSRPDLSEIEKSRLDKALKVLANATSYGIYAEMNRQESEQKVNVTCHGIDEQPFACRVAHPDIPGEYCFPTLASLITGAARLMLALLESCVTQLGGTYAMEDTDSMAVVATKRGELIRCAGGPLRMKDGSPAIKALSWEQVGTIADRFAALNPYDRTAIPGSILKIEEDNFDPKTGKQRQLFCFAISAKRYALFVKDRSGEPVLLRKDVNSKQDRRSEHGLGHLLNPTDLTAQSRDWIGQAWLNIIRAGTGLDRKPIGFQYLPAVGRVTVSSPAVMRAFSKFNAGKRYGARIKPFNFILTAQVKQFGHPPGVDPAQFHLIAPYSSDPKKWTRTKWINQYTGELFRVTTSGQHGNAKTARVKTYGEILREYEFHPEEKCADEKGNACGKQTVGLLQRRHVQIDLIKFIGKESNKLEDVESGLIHSPQSVYTEYCDSTRDEWEIKIRPALHRVPLPKLEALTGLSRRTLIDLRAGRSRPRAKSRELIIAALKEMDLL